MIAVDAAPPAVTAAGVTGVPLGGLYAALRRGGRIGTLRPGCELSGPGARSARLLGPLHGSVDFTHTAPRRVQTITIRGGASARGVSVGATTAHARRAFPHLALDHRSERLFGITLLTVPKRDGGAFQFAVSTQSGRITEIGIPAIAFCE